MKKLCEVVVEREWRSNVVVEWGVSGKTKAAQSQAYIDFTCEDASAVAEESCGAGG